MWFDFFLSVLALTFFFYLPGGVLLLLSRRSIFEVAGFAPIIGVAYYSVAAILYEKIGISCTGWSLFLPFLGLSFLVGFLLRVVPAFRKEIGQRKAIKAELPVVLLYASVGIVVAALFFVKNLDGADSFFQAFDNGFHLSTVRTFIDSGIYSSFATGYGCSFSSPFDSGPSFYPAAWHCLAAMASSATGSSITVSANAVNYVVSAIVFPLSMLFALSRLFAKNRRILVLGSLFVMCVAPFPWGFLTFGPLYPNLLSMSMLPAAAAVSLEFIAFDQTVRRRIVALLAVFASTIALFFAQPNSIFAELILVGPFFVSECFLHSRNNAEGGNKLKSTAVLLGASIAFLVFWLILYSLPISIIRNVVEFNWPASTGRWQAIVDCALFSFNTGAAQPIVSFLVLIGVVKALSSKRGVWLVVSYLFSCFIYILSVSTEGLAKHIFSGFWYTDPYRLAATASIIAVPLLVIGVCWLFSLIKLVCLKIKESSDLCVGRWPSACMAAVVLLAFVYAPSYEIAGRGNMTTAFGNIAKKVEAQNAAFEDKVLTHDEAEFAQEALQKVPEDELILNEPNDGSEFLYALYDAKNIYYKRLDLPSSGESSDSIIIRESIDKISGDQSVAEAVARTGARYVLLLDQGGEPEKRVSFWSYYPEQWEGFSRITDLTPGFEVVMSKGDMRLYKIID